MKVTRLFWLTIAGLMMVCIGLPMRNSGSEVPEGAIAMRPASLPKNRCLESEILIGPVDAQRRSIPVEQILLGDGPHEGVPISPTTDVVEVRFIGAPRWVNRITAVTDAPGFSVAIHDRHGEWIPYGDSAPERDPDGVRSVIGPDVLARGLRLSITGAAREVMMLYRVGAYFEQSDPDEFVNGIRGGDGEPEYHYDWCNDYAGSADDLDRCDNDAISLGDKLPNDWAIYGHGDDNAKEIQLKREDLGGNNGDHLDRADFSYFSGHGDRFERDPYYDEEFSALEWGSNVDDGSTVPSDGRGAWGNGDCEWVALSACHTLKNSRTRSHWANTMNGLHLICGVGGLIDDANYGTVFGGRMKGSSSLDPAKTIKSAWCDAVERKGGAGVNIWILGENSACGSDYIWGEGSVASDPTPNSVHVAWGYTVSSMLAGEAIPEGSLMVASGVATARDLITLPARTPRGFSIHVNPRLLDASQQILDVPVMDVVPVVVDSFYVRAVAEAICQELGVLCGGVIGPGDEDELNLIDGAHELRVCTATGAVEYMDDHEWLSWKISPPQLPSEQNAYEAAEEFLASLGRRPPDAQLAFVGAVAQGAYFKTTGTPMPDSTFSIATRVVYKRVISNTWPVVGPGAGISIAIGQGRVPQRLFEGGWRTVSQGPLVPIVPVSTALDALTSAGWDACVQALRLRVESITILSSAIGYFEPAGDVAASQLFPVHIFAVNITEPGGGVSPAEIYVWADRLQPDANINAPADSTHVPAGSQICFQGEGTGGVPPFTLEWWDDLGNLLGVGPEMCTTFTAPPDTGHVADDRTRTIELRMTDAMGRSGYDHIRIFLDQTTANDEVDFPAPTSFRLHPCVPNPFNPTTTLSYDLARPSAVSLRVYDSQGRLVRVLEESRLLPAGTHRAVWDGRDAEHGFVPSGVYFYALDAGSFHQARKMILLK